MSNREERLKAAQADAKQSLEILNSIDNHHDLGAYLLAVLSLMISVLEGQEQIPWTEGAKLVDGLTTLKAFAVEYSEGGTPATISHAMAVDRHEYLKGLFDIIESAEEAEHHAKH